MAKERFVPNPKGSPGAPDHQATVERMRLQAKSDYPDPKYEIRVNRSIKNETGVNRRPDVAVIDTDQQKVEKVIEAVRTNKNGTFVSRERKKVDQYNKAGIPVHVEPVK